MKKTEDGLSQQTDKNSPQRSTNQSKRRDAKENRCFILSVARNLFKECGVQAVSMHRIAKTAGIGQGTLYRRYAHKGDLCMDLLQESADEFLQKIQTWLSNVEDKLTEVELLHELIARAVQFIDANIHLLFVINSSECANGTSLQFEMEHFQRLHGILVALFRRTCEKNNLPDINVDVTVDFLLNSLNPALYKFEREVRGSSQAQITASICRVFVDGLFRPEV